MPRLGVRTILSMGFFLGAVGLALTSTITPDSGYVSGIMPGMMLIALGSGLSFPAIGNASLHEVTGEDSSLASGVQAAMQQVGGALGLATLVTLALRHAKDALPPGAQPVPALFPEQYTDGFTLAFRIGAVLLAIAGVLVAVLLERVAAVPRTPLAEEVAAEAGEPEPV